MPWRDRAFEWRVSPTVYWKGRLLKSERLGMAVLKFLRRRATDILTVFCFALAAYLVVQPGSRLRGMWDNYRANVLLSRGARQHWDELARVSTPLFNSADSATVIEISDFECPFCRASSPAVDSAVDAGLKIAYLNYPLESHPQAKGAATAALCAGAAHRFRQMQTRLMATSQWQKDSNWTREAQLAGVEDLEAFKTCISSSKVKDRLAQEQALVAALKVRGTPTFITRDAVHQGTISLKELVSLRDAR